MLKGVMANLHQDMVDVVTKFCDESGLFESVPAFFNTGDALRELRNNPTDVLFYDPDDLGNGPGFSVLEAESTVPTIIISKNPHLALKAYEYRNVIDYLVHPLLQGRMEESLDRVLDNPGQEGRSVVQEVGPVNYIFVNVKKRLVRIELDDIHYLASKGDYITVYTRKGQFTTYGTLKSLIPKLSGRRFADVHRSYLVNLDHVVDIGNDSVQVGNAVIPISRLKRKKLLENILCL